MYLDKLNLSDVPNLAEFIVIENYNKHCDNVLPKEFTNEILSISEEEINYFSYSQIFVFKDHAERIQGSIRVLKWNYRDILPIEKIFDINPLQFTCHFSCKDIYHIGRFAIAKDICDVALFKKLMVCAISPICADEKNVAFAECDSKLLRVLTLLGIQAEVIGKPVHYLGSETIPICMRYSGLIDFFEKNKESVSANLMEYDEKNKFPVKGTKVYKQHKNYSLV